MAEKSYFRLQLDSTILQTEKLYESSAEAMRAQEMRAGKMH